MRSCSGEPPFRTDGERVPGDGPGRTMTFPRRGHHRDGPRRRNQRSRRHPGRDGPYARCGPRDRRVRPGVWTIATGVAPAALTPSTRAVSVALPTRTNLIVRSGPSPSVRTGGSSAEAPHRTRAPPASSSSASARCVSTSGWTASVIRE
jgi:hypothetical protein